MPTREIAPYQSDFYVELDSLQNVTDGSYISDATVTVTVYDKSNVAVAGAINLSAPYVASSNGVYRAVVPNTANLAQNTLYDCDVLVVRGGLQVHFWQEILVMRLPA